MKATTNWRIRFYDPDDENSFFFIEGDLNKEGHYPRVEVMQEDYGNHNGYDHNTRMEDAKLIVAAPKMLEALKAVKRHGLIEQDGYETVLKLISDAIDNL